MKQLQMMSEVHLPPPADTQPTRLSLEVELWTIENELTSGSMVRKLLSLKDRKQLRDFL